MRSLENVKRKSKSSAPLKIRFERVTEKDGDLKKEFMLDEGYLSPRTPKDDEATRPSLKKSHTFKSM